MREIVRGFNRRRNPQPGTTVVSKCIVAGLVRCPADLYNAYLRMAELPMNAPLRPIALAMSLAACTCLASTGPDIGGPQIGNESDGTNWLSHGRTYSEQNFSPLHEIDTRTVPNLGLACPGPRR